jgi:hypothetical protein
LNNPTDRELEAKLYSLIDKYHTIKNNVGQQMKNFYIGIFKHFFETEEEEEEYNEEEKETLLQNTKNQHSLQNTNNQPNRERAGVGNLKEGFETQPQTRRQEETKTGELAQSNNNEPPTYTKNVDYTRGSLNPILKETIKRVVSIDSSFRNKKTYPFSTEFTFNLTETLHDVVSLKLYSVSIPYNWYTINQNFGSNFFYIKGIGNGIDNSNFEYKIDIGYGNYTDASLIDTVNASIQRNLINKNPDISFGETRVEHSRINGRCKFTLDIKNNYNETNYYLKFPEITYSNIDPTKVDSSKNSIPELLGYSKKIYYPFSIYSNTFTRNNESTVNITNNTLNYVNDNLYGLNTSNNSFRVEIYEGNIQNDKITSYPITDPPTTTAPAIIKTITVSLETIDQITPITTTTQTYKGTDIFNEINRQLGLHKDFIYSIDNSKNKVSSLIRAVKFNDSPFNIGEDVYTFELSLRPNRKTTVNISNQKMIIKFPNETRLEPGLNPVWTGDGSLFQFPNTIMNFQNINGEINSSTTSYIVSSSPYILLRCIQSGFYTNNPHPNTKPPGSYIATDLLGTAVDINDFKIDISNSSSSGFILSQYYAAIQKSFDNLDISTNGQVKGKVTNTNENYTSLDFNIDYQLTSDNFYIDTTGSFLRDIFFFDTSLNAGESYTSVIGFRPITISNTNNTFVIKSKKNNSNITKSFITECSVSIPAISYNSVKDFNTAVNNAFNDFSKNNIYLSASSFISTGIENGTKIQTVFTLDIRAKLTNRDYKLYFFNKDSIYFPPKPNITTTDDSFNIYNVYYYSSNNQGTDIENHNNSPYQYKWSNKSTDISYVNTNTWGLHFGFTDFSYSLVDATGNNKPVTGTITNTTNQLLLTNKNNTFELIPIYDPLGGVYNIKQTPNPATNNVITFTINLPLNTVYSKQKITDEINKLLKANELTRGSYINTENPITTIRLNINKIFTSKDYSLVFYDANSFTQCNYGSHSSAQVTTTDTTLGWKMGFRSSTVYNMTPENVTTNPQDSTTYYGNYIANTYTYDTDTNIATLMGDTSVNVNLYNYFLIVLDDYTQNHLNDGLITTTIADTDVPLPSYASKASRKCIIPINKEGVSDTNSYRNRNSLTNAQLYSANQVLNTKMTKYSKNIFSNGPFVQDIFGMIPIKTAGLTAGQTYSEFGGTLQIQERVYFGPVNISRMTVRIITDKGNVLDLNNVDWAFSLITEQLYNPNKG